MLNKNEVLNALRDVAGLPVKGRTIYETGDSQGRGTGRYRIDYANFPGGTTGEVPREVIDELEREGLIQRAYTDQPRINSWTLADQPRRA